MTCFKMATHNLPVTLVITITFSAILCKALSAICSSTGLKSACLLGWCIQLDLSCGSLLQSLGDEHTLYFITEGDIVHITWVLKIPVAKDIEEFVNWWPYITSAMVHRIALTTGRNTMDVSSLQHAEQTISTVELKAEPTPISPQIALTTGQNTMDVSSLQHADQTISTVMQQVEIHTSAYLYL